MAIRTDLNTFNVPLTRAKDLTEILTHIGEAYGEEYITKTMKPVLKLPIIGNVTEEFSVSKTEDEYGDVAYVATSQGRKLHYVHQLKELLCDRRRAIFDEPFVDEWQGILGRPPGAKSGSKRRIPVRDIFDMAREVMMERDKAGGKTEKKKTTVASKPSKAAPKPSEKEVVVVAISSEEETLKKKILETHEQIKKGIERILYMRRIQEGVSEEVSRMLRRGKFDEKEIDELNKRGQDNIEDITAAKKLYDGYVDELHELEGEYDALIERRAHEDAQQKKRDAELDDELAEILSDSDDGGSSDDSEEDEDDLMSDLGSDNENSCMSDTVGDGCDEDEIEEEDDEEDECWPIDITQK